MKWQLGDGSWHVLRGGAGSGWNVFNQGIRPGLLACAGILSDLIRVNPTKSDQKSDA